MSSTTGQLDSNGVLADASKPLVMVAGALLLVVFVVWLCRRRTGAEARYTRVAHSLDDEELEFKSSLEMRQAEHVEDVFDFDEGLDDGEFDATELEQIEVLEKYRDSLVTSAPVASAGARGGASAPPLPPPPSDNV